MKKFVIGVTGGFSSGKSTVSELLKVKGAYKIDADRIAHDILEKDRTVQNKIADVFNNKLIINGLVDRKKLGEMVFSNRKNLSELCRITHPVILKKINELISNADNPTVVIDAPLLFESGLYEEMDYIVVVEAKENIQIERGLDRGYTEKMIKNIISSQYPIEDKIKAADFVLNNDEDMNKLKQGVDKLWLTLENQKKKNWI